ncbi:MAG: hypothetical protein SFX74_11215 [Fimbriimonadaceae bacterium]|nr:hypothetical protein [Fimbriimonadaceae bacterium]
MIGTAALAWMVAASATDTSGAAGSAKVVGVSMFKNGYAVVTREIDADASGITRLTSYPRSSLGTLWFSTTGGAKLKRVTTTTESQTQPVVYGSLEQILRANVGKKLRLDYRAGESGHPFVEGTLLSADGDAAVIETSTGVRAYLKQGLLSVSAADGKLVYKAEATTSRRLVRIETEGRGKIVVTSLEQGIRWVPGYALDLSNEKELTLLAKATVVNDLDPIDKVDVRMITGFPNLPWAAELEPFLSDPVGPMPRQYLGMPGGSGGLMAAPSPMTQNVARGAVVADFDNSMAVPATAGGEQREELFFYKYPGMTLQKHDRAYVILFSAKAPYKTLYTCDISDAVTNGVEYRGVSDQPQDVWQTIQFKNTAGQPLTTSVATAYSGDEIVGQGLMNYTSAGANAEVAVNKSLDIRVEGLEEEVSRERGALKFANGAPMYDLVTLRGEIQLTNAKAKAVSLRVRKSLTGEVTDAGTAAVVREAKGLRAVNPNARLTWTPTLNSGASQKLTYQYRLYLRSQ